MEKAQMNLIERIKAPTPKIFRIIRTTGLIIAAAGGAILASPVAIPATIVTVAGYMAVAGSVMTAISQITVDGE